MSAYSIIYRGNGRLAVQGNLIWFEIKSDTCLKKSYPKQWLIHGWTSWVNTVVEEINKVVQIWD